MIIERRILGEKAGSVFGTLKIVLTEKELKEAYDEYRKMVKDDGQEEVQSTE